MTKLYQKPVFMQQSHYISLYGNMTDCLPAYFCREWSGGAMVLVDFRCRGGLFVRIRVGQGPSVLAVYAGGGC